MLCRTRLGVFFTYVLRVLVCRKERPCARAAQPALEHFIMCSTFCGKLRTKKSPNLLLRCFVLACGGRSRLEHDQPCRSLHVLHDEAKDKPFELEMSWITEESGWKYQSVPAAQVRRWRQKLKVAQNNSCFACRACVFFDTLWMEPYVGREFCRV